MVSATFITLLAVVDNVERRVNSKHECARQCQCTDYLLNLTGAAAACRVGTGRYEQLMGW